ncbi:cupin domain-containing protein [Lacibacter sediminis]|uniref:Cupin domain-containing protein n=1 Tax=Lacibacter sediminis TaxID=2760713 RepID=A0A7G5XBU3_9BACT|nr:cupin domain-containing protein [Lacibacter sediminis]QNA42946.1 cupin domain-containing protein [Lacibacter sediminis]
MKRSSFLKFCLAVGGIAATPFKLAAKNITKQRAQKGILVKNGSDRFNKPLSLFDGDKFYCKVSGKDTDGDLYIFDSTRLKEGGPPLHYHPHQDEWWYIITGEYMIKVGDEIFHAKAGDCVFGPRGVPHTFAKVGEAESKLIMLFQPAGKMEEWFNLVNDGVVAKMTEEEKDAARKAHGFVHMGPPLNQLKKS